MSEPPKLPPKREVALALLEGPSLFVHLDPRRENVVVPKWLKNQAQLVLQVGFNMAITIPDLEAGEDGIGCTLSFNRSPIWCFMPWSAIYGLVGEDGRGMIWPDDVPAEVEAMRGKAKAQKPGEKKRAKLAAVSALAPSPGAGPDAVAPDSALPTKRRRAPAAAEPTPDPAAAGPAAAGETSDGGTTKKKLPSYLRVVK